MQDKARGIRNAFRESVLQFIDVVERVPPDAWDKPGLGEWSIRELVAHVFRAMDSPTVYAEPGGPVAAESAAGYYVQAMSSPRVHEEVAERARESAELLDDDPAEAVLARVSGTLAVIDSLHDSAPVTTSIGAVQLIDYLPTRVLEIVVHTLDVAQAAAVPVELSHDALTVTLALLGEIAVAHGDGAALAMALSGRRSLAGDFNVLG